MDGSFNEQALPLDNPEELFALYRAQDDLLTLTTEYEKGQIKRIERMDHGSKTSLSVAINRFNRAVRMQRTLLVAGDLPVFALAGDWPLVRSEPPMAKLGEFMVAVEAAGWSREISSADNIAVKHFPEGSEWTITFYDMPDFQMIVRAVILDEHSIAFRIFSSGPQHRILIRYGHFALMGRLSDASYFGNVKETISVQQTHIEQTETNIWDVSFDAESGMRERVGVIGLSKSDCESVEAEGSIHFTSTAGTQQEFMAVAFHTFDGREHQAVVAQAKRAAASMEDLADRMRQSADYYKGILDSAGVRTGSDILDLGFRHAVLNHEYGHVGKAWLEGGHYWSCYWANNFQISAAISLGQYDRAREALEFFGMRENGYSIISASGEGFGNPTIPILGRSPVAYEGLPYYIYQLDQYIRHTGDLALAEKVLPFLDKMADDLYAVSDPDGNGVLGWKLHANTFIYQADHLQLPGDGASPTLMMIGMTHILSRLARETGNELMAEKYLHLSVKGTENLIAGLWSRERGMFYSHKDPTGIRHTSHYYTDFVFPALYSNLDSSFTRACLDQLIQTLIFRSDLSGLLLMRVGNYKPSMFATDNVMPAQMAEAARALFKEGYRDYAVRLMESVAYGATVYTESPGSFPERQNDHGKGEANFMFGNPYGSYIHSFINGLWGIDAEDGGTKIVFAPQLPREWKHGNIRLGYLSISFEGTGENRTFTIRRPAEPATALVLDIPVNAGSSAYLTINGEKVQTEFVPANGYTRMVWKGPFETDMIVQAVDASPPAVEMVREYQTGDVKEGDTRFDPGVYYTYKFQNDLKIDQRTRVVVHPLPAVNHMEIVTQGQEQILRGEGEAYKLRGQQLDLSFSMVSVVPSIEITARTPADERGIFQFSVVLNRQISDVARAQVDYTICAGKKTYRGVADVPVEGGRNTRQIDMTEYLKDDKIQAMTGWRDEPYQVFLHETEQSEHTIVSGEIFYTAVRGADHHSLMAVVSKGLSDRWTGELQPSAHPDRLVIPLHCRTGSLSVLLVSESQARNMFAQAGVLVVHYEDGTQRDVPLVVGVHLDFLRSSFSTDSEPVKLFKGGGSDYAHVLRIGCDANKTVHSVEFITLAGDFYMGILAVNVGQSQ